MCRSLPISRKVKAEVLIHPVRSCSSLLLPRCGLLLILPCPAAVAFLLFKHSGHACTPQFGNWSSSCLRFCTHVSFWVTSAPMTTLLNCICTQPPRPLPSLSLFLVWAISFWLINVSPSYDTLFTSDNVMHLFMNSFSWWKYKLHEGREFCWFCALFIDSKSGYYT